MNEMKEAVGNWREAKQFSPADENDFLRWLDKADTEEKLFSRLTFWFTFRGLPADQNQRYHLVQERARELRLWNGLGEGLLETLGEYLDANPDIHLVCIDTLSKIKPKAKPFENAYDADYDYMGRLKAFADSRGICVLLVHHTRKSKNPEDSFDNINGSTGILGAADFTIVLDKQSRMDDEAGFLLTGRDIEQCERVIRFDQARCRWVMQGTAAQLAAQRRVAEYEAEPIVKTLRVLLQQGDGTWSGYSKNLMEMGQRYAHTELAPTSQALAKRITELEPMLWERDAVKHWMQDNGSSAKRHCFRQQRIDNTVADSSSAQLSLRHKYC